MSSSCRKWHQDTLHYLRRECLVRLVVVRHQELNVFWRNRPSGFFLHWSLCSNAHTTTSLRWVRAAVCREHDIRVSLSRKYRYRPRKEQDEFHVPPGWTSIYRLYSIGARTEPWGTTAAIFLGVENSPSIKTLNFLSVRKKAISLMRLVENYNSRPYMQ
jgi:hypothetical protein